MRIKQDKEYQPVSIVLETQEEYDSFFRIIEEVIFVNKHEYTQAADIKMARDLSSFATNNV